MPLATVAPTVCAGDQLLVCSIALLLNCLGAQLLDCLGARVPGCLDAGGIARSGRQPSDRRLGVPLLWLFTHPNTHSYEDTVAVGRSAGFGMAVRASGPSPKRRIDGWTPCWQSHTAMCTPWRSVVCRGRLAAVPRRRARATQIGLDLESKGGFVGREACAAARDHEPLRMREERRASRASYKQLEYTS